MPALLIYLLKVNAALLLFCLGYYGVLRKLTFYSLNRVYLITAILFSSLYPVVNIDSLLQRHEKLSAPLQPLQIVVIDLSDRVVQITQPATTSYWEWLVMLFWAGVAIMSLRLAAQFWSLFKIYRRSKPTKIYNHEVRVINEEANPFSFWQSIYINPAHHAPNELQSIIAHEQVHVKQWHTLDILLAEISLVFYWFNPGVWLMKKAVAENLEFITDRKILQQGIDPKSYQYSLLYASFNTSPNAMVNHFNISTIKKRIMMMNSKRSSRFSLTRYGFIAPAILALLLVFGTSKAAFIKSTIKNAQTATKQAIADMGLTQPIAQKKQIDPSNAAKDYKQPEKIVLHQTAINTTVPDIDVDTPKLKVIPKISSLGDDSVLYVIDGVRVTNKADLKKFDLNTIESIDILKNADAVKLFGEEGNKGVVIIFSKNAGDSEANKQLHQKIYALRAVNGQNILSTQTTGVAAIRINGNTINSNAKPTGYYTPAGTTQKIPLYGSESDILATVASARKNSSAINELVKKRDSIDRNIQGLIRTEVSSTAKAERLKDVVVVGYGTEKSPNITIKGKSGQPEPLWVVDGKQMPFSPLPELNPDSIETITVLKDASATALYGTKAVNGVVIITTKKATKAPKKN